MADESYSTRVAANGTATVNFTPTKSRPWLLRQVSIEMANAPSGCTAELRKNGNLITVMIASDVADSEPPIPVSPGDRMQVLWYGATPNAIGNVYIIYNETDWANV